MNLIDGPLVSVIIPAFNARSTLEETLRSVAAQTYANIEIIIVDDGSTDGTPEIAEAFCKGEARARLIRKPNGGVAAARNAGIANAHADWLAPIDSDDLWHPTKIEKQVRLALASARPPGFVFCWYHYIDEESRVIGSGPEWNISGAVLNRLAGANFVQNGSALLLWRPAVEAVGGYDPGLRVQGGQGCEDILIELQIAHGFPVEVVTEHLVGYRCLSASMSRDSAQMTRSWDLVWQALERQQVPVPPASVRWTRAQCCIDLAQESAVEGRPARCLRFTALAFWFDPIRSSAYLLYRLARLSVRLVRGRGVELPRVAFAEISTTAWISDDPDRLPALWRMIERIDERRVERLARAEPGLESVQARATAAMTTG